MSDHPKEAERNLKRIRICDDIYLDVFYLLAPAKIGLELALVSDRFDALVDTHLKSRKWTLGKLRINSKNIAKINDDGSEKEVPFPHKPLPNSIIGFACVNIWSLNSGAITFLQSIGRLFESNVPLELNIDREKTWNIFATFVWPLLNVSAIIKIRFGHPSVLQNFRCYISPSILRDCSNLRFITFNYDFFHQFPPDDSKGSSDGQALCKWLLTPRADGQPKVFKCYNFMRELSFDALKATFLNATTSVSFIIRLRVYISLVGPFELVNSLTREQLTCRPLYGDKYWWLIERSPIDKSAEKWAEWKKEALEYGTNDWKVLGFFFV